MASQLHSNRNHADISPELHACLLGDSVNESCFLNADYVVFFTGYCNHALTDNALRLVRQHDLPAGYANHVNIDMFLQDVARIGTSVRPKSDSLFILADCDSREPYLVKDRIASVAIDGLLVKR